MVNWRLLKLEASNAYRNMAIDESMLVARKKGLVPNTLRFYRWKPSAVSIGKFQDLEKEVQLVNCRKQGVDLVRRITGGGTVYHDSAGEITYSIVASKQDLGTSDIGAIYTKLCGGLVEALRILGVVADFNTGTTKACPNLTVRGKKISGSAQTHKAGIVLQHGTLLLKVDFEKMFTLLQVSRARTCTEIVTVAREKITSINRELRKDTSAKTVNKALEAGFSRALNVELLEGKMTSYELDLAARLQKEKYGKDDWNFYGQISLA
jgi:lipoyltransferase/lipoate-protein ligase